MRIRRGWGIAAVALVLLPLLVVAIRLLVNEWPLVHTVYVPPKPVAPPDLAKLRSAFTAGLDAIRKKDAQTAIKQLGSFTFGGRAAEEYRLFYLARANELAGDAHARRLVLARLWERDPRLAVADDAGAALGELYASAGDWNHATEVYGAVSARSIVPATAAAARWHSIETSFATGDLASLAYNARRLVIGNPKQPQAADAIAVVRSLTVLPPDKPVHLTDAERLERGVSLMRDGDPAAALVELNALDSAGVTEDLKGPLQLNRGLCLYATQQYEASNKLLEPLATWNYRVSAPALFYAARNYRALSAATNPIVIKTVVQRVKQHLKGKKTRFVNVKRTVQSVDLAKKAKKAEYDRLAVERLKDTLSLPLVDEVRIDVLNQLIGLSEARNDDASERQFVRQLANVDPAQDAALQHFWDKAWADYARGDWKGARDSFAFIYDTYRSQNPRRQARYWFARAIEHAGETAEAQTIYAALADAPYEDIYATFSAGRGATAPPPTSNPLNAKGPDWPDIAEKQMPPELRLAYELTALSDARDARLELQRNTRRANQLYSFALMADLYNSEGNMLLMMRSIRKAYPQLGSVDQDSVPRYFLRMYHPTLYADTIRKAAASNGVDPYVIMGLIHQESYYNPKARSAPGAVGLMQLMPATGKELAQRLHVLPSLDNPETNIKLGTLYFHQLVTLFNGKTQLAIAAYNAGRGNVAKWQRAAPQRPDDEMLESIPFPETRTYVKRVTMLGSSYRRLYAE